jgi:purine nucleoside phosphorylase
VAVRDHLNLAGDSPLVGLRDDGPRFVHVDGVYRNEFRLVAAAGARGLGWELPEGVYARVADPLPPTSAEGRWLKGLGVDMVGSRIVDQSIVAARLGLGVLALVVLAGWAGSPRNQDAEREGLERGRLLLERTLPMLAEHELHEGDERHGS